jgi:Cof subfamily protein (haloacid dehalogenase superfamily)
MSFPSTTIKRVPRYKLLAIDLDGTLLDAEKRVSARNVEALRKAADSGVKVMISSGRIFPEAELCVKGLDSVSLISACNGADIRETATGRSIRTATLDAPICIGILGLLRREPLFYALYSRDTVYVEKARLEAFPSYRSYIEGRHAKAVVVDGLEERLAEEELGICKIYVASPEEGAARAFRSKLSGRDGIEVTSSWPNNAEIMAAGIDKGSALSAAAGIYGIAGGETAVLGDSENDLSMFRAAGLPIAMGNAEARVLEAAAAVTLSNSEDGVAAAIESYILA